MDEAMELKGWMVDRPGEIGGLEIRAEALEIVDGCLVFKREGTTWMAYAPGAWTYVDRCWVGGERAAG